MWEFSALFPCNMPNLLAGVVLLKITETIILPNIVENSSKENLKLIKNTLTNTAN